MARSFSVLLLTLGFCLGCSTIVAPYTKILGTLDISGPPRIFLIAPVAHDLISGALEAAGLPLATSLRAGNLVVDAKFGNIKYWRRCGPVRGIKPVRALKLLVREGSDLKAVIVGRACEDDIVRDCVAELARLLR